MPKRSIAARGVPNSFEQVLADWAAAAKTVAPVELWCFLILGVVIFLVYLPGIAIPYYGDDVGWFDAVSNPWRHFVQVNADGWYRPLQAGIYTVVQKHFGLSTVPIHLAMLLIHALLCVLVIQATTDLGYGGVSALLAGVLMALSQANAFALLSNDTLSQVAGTFFGCLALWALARPHLRRRSAEGSAGMYLISIGAFAVALLFKETTSSFLPLLLCVVALINYREPHWRGFITRSLAMSLPFVVVFLGYLGIRTLVGANSPSFGTGGYQFHIGSNVILNVLMDFAALVLPVSSVTVYEALVARSTATLALIGGAAAFFVAVIAYGLWLKRRDWRPAIVVLMMLGSVFPMVIMNHVSELYVYNTTPFFSILAGIGLGAVLESEPLRRYVAAALSACILLLLAGQVTAIRDKALLMQENGERAARLVAAIGDYIRQVPPHGALLLVNPPKAELEYAVYLMPGFKVLEFEESYMKKIYGREDIDLSIVDEADLKSRPAIRDTVMLGLQGDTLTPLATSPKKAR
jgi:hypothetical protein